MISSKTNTNKKQPTMKLTHGSGTEGVEMKKAPTTEVMRALVLGLLKKRVFNNSCRGRNAGYPAPPAQIRT